MRGRFRKIAVISALLALAYVALGTPLLLDVGHRVRVYVRAHVPAAAAPHHPRVRPVLRAHASTTACMAHVTGATLRRWLRNHPCRSLRRAMYTTTAGRRPVIVTVAIIDTGSHTSAVQLQNVAAGPDARITTLLKEGHRFHGAPAVIDNAASASTVRGTRAVFTLADYTTGPSVRTDRRLKTAASAALTWPA